MFRSKKVGLLGRILLILLLAYMIYSLISVRQEISAAKAEVEILTEQLAEQEQYNTELSNAIENRDNPDFVEDIAREFGFVCLTRGGDACAEMIAGDAYLSRLSPYIEIVETPEALRNVSSTAVRQHMAQIRALQGEIERMVPQAVLPLL